MLKLGAINFDAGPRISEERLGHGPHRAGLSGTGRSKKNQIAHRASGRIQSRQKHLVDFYHLFDRLVLPNNLASKRGLEVFGIVTATCRVESGIEHSFHKLWTQLFLSWACIWFPGESGSTVVPSTPKNGGYLRRQTWDIASDSPSFPGLPISFF